MTKTFSQWADEWWWRFDKMGPRTAFEIEKNCKNPENFISVCKLFIDHHERGHEYTFSDDFKYFKRVGIPEPTKDTPYHEMSSLPDGIRVEMVREGFVETLEINSRKITVTHCGDRGRKYVPSYRVYRGETLIAIET